MSYEISGRLDTDTFILKLRNNTRGTTFKVDFHRMGSYTELYNSKTLVSDYSGFMGIASLYEETDKVIQKSNFLE